MARLERIDCDGLGCRETVVVHPVDLEFVARRRVAGAACHSDVAVGQYFGRMRKSAAAGGIPDHPVVSDADQSDTAVRDDENTQPAVDGLDLRRAVEPVPVFGRESGFRNIPRPYDPLRRSIGDRHIMPGLLGQNDVPRLFIGCRPPDCGSDRKQQADCNYKNRFIHFFSLAINDSCHCGTVSVPLKK